MCAESAISRRAHPRVRRRSSGRFGPSRNGNRLLALRFDYHKSLDYHRVILVLLNEYSVRDGYDYPLLITDVVSLDGQGVSWNRPAD